MSSGLRRLRARLHGFRSAGGGAPAGPRRVPLARTALADGAASRGGRWVRSGEGEDAARDAVRGFVERGNAVCNRKYSAVGFVPQVLYEQFRMFYNLFFLLVALSQLVPTLRVGFFWTYFGPLVFVVLVSVLKEASDDVARWRRDVGMNLFAYTLLVRGGGGGAAAVRVASEDIRVGDVIVLETNERVPADCVLLRASAGDEGGEGGSIFVRTDQLDGETDWKLRRAVGVTQAMRDEGEVLERGGVVEAEAPRKEIYDFVGVFDSNGRREAWGEAGEEEALVADDEEAVLSVGGWAREPLGLENTLWANTVVASGRAMCVVVYNGRETRSVMNAASPTSKVGKLEQEINAISKMLFVLLFSLSAVLTVLRGLTGQWLLYFFRYFLLLSAIIPISMRVNLDMAKVVYSFFMQNDHARMPGCTVRNSNLPEELGRIQYLLTDKTGTLTQNEMAFKKLHLGSVLFARESLDDVRDYARAAFDPAAALSPSPPLLPDSASASPSPLLHPLPSTDAVSPTLLSPEPAFVGLRSGSGSGSGGGFMGGSAFRGRRVAGQVRDALLAIALAHNVTPVEDGGVRTYQAASPDEVALVKFAESVGITLEARTVAKVVLRLPGGREASFDLLAEFPFTSEAKRMGIVVRDCETGAITLYVKGADTVMAKRVRYNDWLDEECGNLAREGLRTLVFAKRELSAEEYAAFAARWTAARTSQVDRKGEIGRVQTEIETDMQLLALTGVEDKLQVNVRETLEKLRHAGVRVWMLTGDKVETATCIAVSSRLAERQQGIFTITGITTRNEASRALARFRQQAATDVLVVDGTSLQVYLDMFPAEFVDAAALSPAAVACRCSPTQKAAVVRLLQEYKGKRVAAIGDGGNDVSMILQADAGIGIPGKEGKQASMAADFSITAFSHLTRLLLWHGRNSYKRSARLAQFVMHRGLIISIIQVVYCALFFYAAVSVYSGWILVGYATVFTMFPVFSLILDEDVTEQAAETYPELYKDLQKGRSLNVKTFLIWVFKSIYQGTVVMVFSVYVLWDDEYFTTLHLSAISFTALILTELLMVAVEVHVWHWVMVFAEACSVAFYIASILVLQDTFDTSLMLKWGFLGRVFSVTLVSCVPVTLGKWLKRKIAPASYSKIV